MDKENFNIMYNVKIVEGLKADLLCIIGDFFKLLTKGSNVAKESVLDCISGAIIILYLLAERLGYSHTAVDEIMKKKLKIGIIEEDKIELQGKDLTKLSEEELKGIRWKELSKRKGLMEVKMQKSTYDTKALIEGSLTTAITVVMMLINVYVPVFSIFANFILPIPITLLYIKQNYKVTLISVIASGILMSIFYNPIFALSLIILTGLTGMTLGYCIKNKMKFSTTMVFLSIAMAVGIIFYFTVYIMFISKGGIYGFVNKIVEDFKQSMDLSKNMYEKAGVSSNQLSSMESMLKIFTPEYIMKLIPAVIIIMSFTLSYLNYIITRSILKKLKYQMNESKPLGQWYMNTRVGTLVGLILVIGILFNRRNMAAGQYLVASSKIILELIFFIDGIALLTYYLLKKFIIAVIIILTALSSLSLFYVLAGFIDMIFDFRKLDPYRKSGKK
jgi:uncharacterized protein YybS (DUF2232 family)